MEAREQARVDYWQVRSRPRGRETLQGRYLWGAVLHPCMRSRHFCVHIATGPFKGGRISVISVTLEPFRAIFRLPCMPSRHPRRRAAAEPAEGDRIRAFFATLGLSYATFRLPCQFSWRHGRRAAAEPAEGDVSGMVSIALEPFHGIFRLLCVLSRHPPVHSLACIHGTRPSARSHTHRMMQNQQEEPSTRLRTRYNTHMCPLSSAG